MHWTLEVLQFGLDQVLQLTAPLADRDAAADHLYTRLQRRCGESDSPGDTLPSDVSCYPLVYVTHYEHFLHGLDLRLLHQVVPDLAARTASGHAASRPSPVPPRPHWDANVIVGHV